MNINPRFLLTLFFCITCSSKAAPKLLPFQGHLTSASGQQVADGTKVVQFKIYDTPVSGAAVWAGEVHKLSINGGLVNSLLGTKTTFPETYADGSKVMFSEPLYVEITVDANNDGEITAADPPLLPRQVLLPANFAHVTHSVRSTDGTEVISPSGDIDGSQIRSGSILGTSLNTVPLDKLETGQNAQDGLSSSQIASNAITDSELALNAVNSIHIQDGQISTSDIGNAQITTEKIASGIQGSLFAKASLPVDRIAREFAYFWDQKPFNQDGGFAISGTQTRSFNQGFIRSASITRTGNQISLKPGIYRISASAPAYSVNRHQIHLFNLTTETVAIAGTSELAFFSNVATRSHLFGFLELTEDSNFELRHFTYGATGKEGLGVSAGSQAGSPASPSIPSVYSQIYIERIE